MTSILTNNSAIVALQTLRTIGSNLETTQSQISTGKKVGSAADNAASFAISKVMESDVAGFRAISESLSLGGSTVGVALAGAEQITDILLQIKEKVVAATGENVDNSKIDADVTALKDQITSIIGAAQFNGANLLDSSLTVTGGLSVLSSLDRDNTGGVSASNITVAAVDFAANLNLATVDVTTSAAADTSLGAIEALIQTAVDGASSLGASLNRIQGQSEFVGQLSDSLRTGIGALVDADLEEASARLQALQVQQQLGIQALSIANQQPQNILALFR